MPNQTTKLQPIINYIENNLNSKLTLDKIATHTNYSKYHLHRTFKTITGITIHQYIKRRQLTQAAKKLTTSDKPILQIALSAGYESQQAFTNIFTKYYKLPPQQYRTKKQYYPLKLPLNLKENCPKNPNKNWQVNLAKEEDIPAWMELVHQTIDGFPNLQETTYIPTLKKYIAKKQAFIIKQKNLAQAIMLLSPKTQNIDFISTNPQNKDPQLATSLLQKALSQLKNSNQLTTTTFRANDKADNGQRKLIKNLGFTESKLLEEFGYPSQQFLYKKRRQHEQK